MSKKQWQIKSIKQNFFYCVFLKVSSIIFTLISMPYVNRVLGAEGTGKVAFATSVISYFLMIAQMGVPTYGVRTCAACREDIDELSKTVKELLHINFISASISYTLFIVCLCVIPKLRDEKMLMIILSVAIYFSVFGMEWLFQAIEQYSYITKRNIIFKLIGIIALFCMVRKPKDYIIYGVITIISSYAPCLLNYLYSFSIIKKKINKKLEYKKHLKPIMTFFALTIAVSVYASMDAVMLGFISGDTQVGYYNLGTKAKLILATMIASLGTVLMPRLSYYLSIGETKQFSKLIKKSFHFVLVASVSVCVFFIIMAKDTILFLGGNSYLPAVPCMKVIMLTIIPLTVGNIASMQILAPLKKEKYTMYSTIAGALINLCINYLLIPRYGALGAAIATVITETVVMLIQVYFSYSYIVEAIKSVNYIRILFSVMMSGGILLLSTQYIAHPGVVRLIICAILYFLIYGCMLLITRDEFAIYLMNSIIMRLKKND